MKAFRRSNRPSPPKIIIPHYFRRVEFDRKKIKAGISLPNNREALRATSKPIYNQLITELYENSCPITAKYFEMFSALENRLYQGRVIRDRVFNAPKLLMALFDNCKMAEQAVHHNPDGGDVICCKLMFENILICQEYTKQFGWLIYEIFEIIAKTCTKLMETSPNNKEYLCRIYCQYAMLLAKIDIQKALHYFELAYELVLGTEWKCKERITVDIYTLFINVTYSSFVGKQYVKALLSYANMVVLHEPELAVKVAEKSIKILKSTNVDEKSEILIYIQIRLNFASALIDCNRILEARKVLNIIEPVLLHVNFDNIEMATAKCRLIRLFGLCFEKEQENNLAFKLYNEALSLSRRIDSKEMEADSLIRIAQIYLQRGVQQHNLAEDCLMEAKRLLRQLGDTSTLSKCSYILIKMRSQRLFPFFADLIRMSLQHFPDMCRLREWKNRCTPFWMQLDQVREREETEPLEQLLRPPTLEAYKFYTKP